MFKNWNNVYGWIINLSLNFLVIINSTKSLTAKTNKYKWKNMTFYFYISYLNC